MRRLGLILFVRSNKQKASQACRAANSFLVKLSDHTAGAVSQPHSTGTPVRCLARQHRSFAAQASSALQPSSAEQSSLTVDSDIETAVRGCFSHLRRSPDSGECTKLAEAVAMKVPLRLLATLRSLLASSKPAASIADGNVDASLPDASGSDDEAAAPALSADDAGINAAAELLGSADLANAALLAETANEVAPELDPDIMKRCCPAFNRGSRPSSYDVKVTTRTRGKPYALKEAQLPGQVQAELDAFTRWCTTKFYGQQTEPIADVTARKYRDHLRGILGWLVAEGGVPLQEVSLKHAIPSHDRSGTAVAFDYLQWLTSERGVSPRTEGLVIRSIMSAAKFLYHAESTVRPSEGDRPYSDLEVVRELRAMANMSKKAGKVAGRVADENLKWLDWPQFLAVVQRLRQECAGLDLNRKARAKTAVAWSLQRYLIFAILSCVPDRQRTLRELRIGKTLFKEDSRWVIRHGAGDYKTGRSYGERPPLTLAPHIYPELEAFMDTWRQHLQPQHDFLFTRKDGQPHDDRSMYKLFWTTAYRISGKRANPHLVRDSCVTYLRGIGGATERELEALAIYMGHSINMQRDTYDRRTKAQKVAPAVELLASLNRRASGS